VINLETMKLAEFLDHSIPCDCGRNHSTTLQMVEISSGALAKLPKSLRQLGYHRPFIVSDVNTQAIAGRQVADVLEQADLPYVALTIDTPEVVPDEATLGRVFMRFDLNCDLIIAVGSGTINDICRFVSHRLGRPYIVVATAPSMDGFASSVAPLITNNLKTTYAAQIPLAIFADLDVLTKAPLSMIAAGFGDVLGKYTCLLDWRLAALINNEYYCETIAALVKLALQRTIANTDGLLNREQAAIAQLTEALILVGIAMSYSGNSRPASGSEHHLSHFWETRLLFEGKKAILHGTKVGIATIIILKLYEYLRATIANFKPLTAATLRETDRDWEQKIRRVFQAAAPEVLLLETTARKNSPAKRNQRLIVIKEQRPEIRRLVATLPASGEIERLLSKIAGPTRPAQVGLDPQTVKESVLYAKEIRDRYTVLQLLWDLQLLESFADRVVADLWGTPRL
jgi:glycerol-1-phosphate dehydrogenase [NAD(P)+]